MLCGGHHSPIRGRQAPHDDVQSQVWTNLLYEVYASKTNAACDLSTPEVLFRSLPHAQAKDIHLISFLYGCGELNWFVSRPLCAITPAATVLQVVKRNWRRFGCGDSGEGS